jgi:branched-chain amino acid transport system permease protein
MNYLLHIIVFIEIYIIAGISLNLISGYTGLISIAHAAFYGVGAYISALLALHFHTPFLLNLALAITGAVVIAFVVSLPSLRLSDDYFIIATFAFQIIIYSVMNNWVSFTGGPLGLLGISQPVIFGWRVNGHLSFLVLCGIFALLVFLFSRRIANSPYGRVLRAIREDEILAEALGKNSTRFKISIFLLGSGFVAIAGSLYAVYITFIDPSSFTVVESIFMLSIVIVGGIGNLWGSVVGAVMLVSIPEILRFLGMPNSIAANIRQILYGVLLVLFMMFRSRGMIGERRGE